MKSYLLLAMALLLNISACAGNSSGNANDSAAVAATDNKNQPEVITDAICMDAKGEISKIEETVKQGLYEATTVYTFNNKGELISSELLDSDAGNDGLKMERDANGMPTKMILKVFDDMGEEEEYSISFSYDNAHRLIKEGHENFDSSWTTTYTRDSDGNIILMTVNDPFGGTQKSTITYPEGAFDSHGNWTKRIFKSEDGTTTVTRKITYK